MGTATGTGMAGSVRLAFRALPWRALARAFLALFLLLPTAAVQASDQLTPSEAREPRNAGYPAMRLPGTADGAQDIAPGGRTMPALPTAAPVRPPPSAPDHASDHAPDHAPDHTPAHAPAQPGVGPREDHARADAKPADTAPSALERVYRERYDSALSASLAQFGYEFFSAQPDLRRPDAPADAAYVLGPGDMLGVRLMGAALDREAALPVSREGNLDLPGMGLVAVSGLPLAKAEAAVTAFARRYAPGVEARLRVTRMRDLEVYVVGEVERPGLTRAPGRATTLSALIAAGGIKKSGSLRKVRVTRGGKDIAQLDLYGLLLLGRLGEAAGDVPLVSGDVVFVPRIGPTAAVAGAVSDPRIYELAGERGLADVLALAGGGLPQAEVRRVLVRAFSPGAGFGVRDIDATRPGALKAEPVADGDLLEVRFQPAEWPRAVRLEGHVRQPEVLAWREGLRLSDVLASPEQLKPGAVTDFGLLRRWDARASRWSVSAFPLGQVLAKSHDMPLAPHDVIEVLSREAYGVSEPVSLRGAVWKEGDHELTPGMTLVDLLALGGGLRFGADAARIEVSRKRLLAGEAVTESVTVDLASDRGFPLQPHDTVLVPGLKDATAFRQAAITGQVRYPGVYRIENGETLSSLIRRAGGFTPEAYFHGARFTSLRARAVQQESLDRLVREMEMWADKLLAEQAQTTAEPEETEGAREARAGLGKLLARLHEVKAEGRVAIVLANLEDFAGSEHDFVLEDGDELDVPAKPSFVSVVGSVYTPSSFLYRPEDRVDDYLSRSGGPTRNADKRHMYVLKANGEVLSMAQSGMGSHRFKSLRLMPGDTLVVPEDLERVPYFRFFRGITDSLFKIATTAGIALAIL